LMCKGVWRYWAALIGTMIPCYAETQRSSCNKGAIKSITTYFYPWIISLVTTVMITK
jgi:hypothetical protein